MTSPVFDVGDLARADVVFKVGVTSTDPTTVTAFVDGPNAEHTEYVYGTDAEVVKDGTGLYHIEFPMTRSGPWHVRFEGTGNVETAAEVMFWCRRSAFVVA